MPPKMKATAEMIVNAAIEVVRQSGFESINARTVSGQLHCSTQPVMYHFSTIDNLKRAAYRKADRLHSEYMINTPTGQDPILGIGLNYVRFAVEEPQLFRFLFESGYAKENRARAAAVEERISALPKTYIPKARIREVESQIRSGDILCFTTAIEGLDVSHVVIAYRAKSSDRLGFIHASINEKKVIIDSRTLEAALSASRNITGIKVLRVQP